MKNQDVTDLDYDAITYDKPAGEVIFKAAYSSGFPSRYRPDVVMVEVVDDGVPHQFTGVFANSTAGVRSRHYRPVVLHAPPVMTLTVFVMEVFIDMYRARKMLWQPDWSDWRCTMREGQYYHVNGQRRKLLQITQVLVPNQGDSPVRRVFALLRFGQEEKLNVV